MNQKTRILVLAVAKPYDMIPEGSLERVSGCAMHYVITDDVSRDQFDEDTGEVGYIPAKEKCLRNSMRLLRRRVFQRMQMRYLV